MKYFLTGATGFVGGVLAQKLRNAGHEVRALVHTMMIRRRLRIIIVEVTFV